MDQPPTTLWTKGWIPDSAPLRWSLAKGLTLEGVIEGQYQAAQASELATLWFGWLGEDEAGDEVEVDEHGRTLWEEEVEGYRPVTFAMLNLGVLDE